MFEVKTINADTIKIEAKDIKDNAIYELEGIRETLDTYNVIKMSWYEYDYEPYYSWGERKTRTPLTNNFKNYVELLDWLIKQSQADRRRGWSNKINFLNITCQIKNENNQDKLTMEIYKDLKQEIKQLRKENEELKSNNEDINMLVSKKCPMCGCELEWNYNKKRGE